MNLNVHGVNFDKVFKSFFHSHGARPPSWTSASALARGEGVMRERTLRTLVFNGVNWVVSLKLLTLLFDYKFQRKRRKLSWHRRGKY